jgi:hypothetical protein
VKNSSLWIVITALLVLTSCGSRIDTYDGQTLQKGKLTLIDADGQKGFLSPFLLYIPEYLKDNDEYRLLCAPNNTGTDSDDMKLHTGKAVKEFHRWDYLIAEHEFPYIILVPVFPRFSSIHGGWKYYAQALDRDSMYLRTEKKPCLTIRYNGIRPGEYNALEINLDNLFIVQNDKLYRCIASSHKPPIKIYDTESAEVSLLFESGWTPSSPFNVIEYSRYNTGLWFRDVRVGEESITNSADKRNSSLYITDFFYAGDDDFAALVDRGGTDFFITDGMVIERLDLQLIQMIEYAEEILGSEFKISLKGSINMAGFSTSAHFTDRFCFLHPNRVNAASLGGFNGHVALPLDVYDGVELIYPFGTSDYHLLTGQVFDESAFSSIKRFLYQGSEDENDDLVYSDGYEMNESSPIIKLFGAVVPERLKNYQKLFERMGLDNHRFAMYEGVGHSLTNQMKEDIADFFWKVDEID